MLERVALHQTRFRTPGVGPDPRGVLLGQRGVVLFPSLDRLVAFLRAYSDEGSLDELVPSLRIERVTTKLRTRELLFSIDAESSYRMDRVASIAKLAGGMVFTGTQQHFVQYRDAASPLGYDIAELVPATGADEQVLYADSFEQAYTTERELRFRDLLLKLSPHRSPTIALERATERCWVSAEVGVGHALVGYLFRWQIDARAALAEWPSESAFDDAPRRLFLFDVSGAPARIVGLMRDLPGVRVYEPIGGGAAVELGYHHPVALDSCASIFAEGLTLFAGAPESADGLATPEVLRLAELPAFAPVRSLVRASMDVENAPDPAPPVPAGDAPPRALRLRLAASSEPYRSVIATAVPTAERVRLARLLYVLPPNILAALRVAITPDHVYLLDPTGIEGAPIGRFFSQVAPRVYVPAGMMIVPAVSAGVLSELIPDQGNAHVFFHPEHPDPVRVPDSAFGSVARSMIDHVAARPVHADAPERVDPELPLFHYDDVRMLPFRGVPQPPRGAGETDPDGSEGSS